MKKNKGYKYRIYPNNFQREFFEKCFGARRWLWNEMLEDRSYAYKKYDVTITPQPAWYKTNFPFLKEVDFLSQPITLFYQVTNSLIPLITKKEALDLVMMVSTFVYQR